jgi:hypothetical protein
MSEMVQLSLEKALSSLQKFVKVGKWLAWLMLYAQTKSYNSLGIIESMSHIYYSQLECAFVAHCKNNSDDYRPREALENHVSALLPPLNPCGAVP